MPRLLPPHLMALVAFLIVIVWLMLLHQFRSSAAMQRFIAEVFGDNTPEGALREFEAAKRRLAGHLEGEDLDPQMRGRIETALGLAETDQCTIPSADECSF